MAKQWTRIKAVTMSKNFSPPVVSGQLCLCMLGFSIGLIAGCNKIDPDVKIHINELDDDEAGDRLDAAKELENMGKRATPAIPELAKRLKDENRKVRYRAAKALAKLGLASKSVSNQLGDALSNDDYVKVRYYAAKALDEIADHEPAQVKGTLPNLIKALDDEDAKTRRYVLKTLAKLGADAYGVLDRIELLLDDKDKDVRKTAESTIRRIKKKFTESSQG